jgi:hypothetical protein
MVAVEEDAEDERFVAQQGVRQVELDLSPLLSMRSASRLRPLATFGIWKTPVRSANSGVAHSSASPRV